MGKSDRKYGVFPPGKEGVFRGDYSAVEGSGNVEKVGR